METITLDISTFMAIMFAIINLVILGPAAWIVKDLIGKQRDLEKSHNDHKQHVSDHYVKQKHFENDMDEIKRMLTSIFNKMDGKADKEH